jgi:hypothetical protein
MDKREFRFSAIFKKCFPQIMYQNLVFTYHIKRQRHIWSLWIFTKIKCISVWYINSFNDTEDEYTKAYIYSYTEYKLSGVVCVWINWKISQMWGSIVGSIFQYYGPM